MVFPQDNQKEAVFKIWILTERLQHIIMVIELLQIIMEKTSFLIQIFDSQYYFQDFKMTSIDPHLAKPVLDS